ncbi:NUDIX domain-containing protein [Polaribacter sp. MSW5]|uniref:GDP-mannose pyrophosphatase n=1 Tax=Polaribacter ponticola TaxID=2978475 RepID=A0ABT5SAA7_9FLAO|nr:NUDIX domain-containing protein [Polaribacter sp. MSW5]MDD7914520.1 NUDIX domain-containing protein [Polaribacter sp. MSW5]
MKSNDWGKLEDINFDYTFESGVSKNLTFEIYGKSDGIAILLYNPTTNKVILSKQFRAPVYVHGISEGFSIEVVGGAIDKNESPESAAIRETEEEVGYKIDAVKRISTVFLSPGIVNEKVHLFIGEYSDENKTENGGGVIAEGEEIEVLETEFSEALKMIENEEIIDARTIMLLQYLKINKLID